MLSHFYEKSGRRAAKLAVLRRNSTERNLIAGIFALRGRSCAVFFSKNAAVELRSLTFYVVTAPNEVSFR